MKRSRPAPVSVVIPSKARPNELRCLLQSIDNQADEVLVMLDGVDHDTKNSVEKKFPNTKIYMSDKSFGPLYHRNRGAKMARNEIIVFLDDDIMIQSNNTIDQTMKLFESDNIGAVTIPFFNADDNEKSIYLKAPSNDGCYYTSTFYAGMVAFRKSAFLQAGGYREILFYYFEESDIALRMMNLGFYIRLGNSDPILHAHSPRRNSERVHYLGARNNVLFTFFNVPMPILLIHLPITIVKRIIHAIRIQQIRINLLGILAGMIESALNARERKPVAREAYQLCRALRRD